MLGSLEIVTLMGNVRSPLACGTSLEPITLFAPFNRFTDFVTVFFVKVALAFFPNLVYGLKPARYCFIDIVFACMLRIEFNYDDYCLTSDIEFYFY